MSSHANMKESPRGGLSPRAGLHKLSNKVSKPAEMHVEEAEPLVAEVPLLACTFKVCMQEVSIRRADGVEEDDFKTWAHAVVLTHGRPNGRLWYTGEEMLGRTSVRVVAQPWACARKCRRA